MSKKYRELASLSNEKKNEKLKDLRLELIKKNVTANKAGKVKAKEIKKAIARLLTAINAKK